MEIGTQTRRKYRVAIDRSHVEKSEVGVGRIGARVRCAAPLVGGIDENWRVSFRSMQLEDSGFFRFRLEMGSNLVTFTTRASAGGDVSAELKILEFLVDAVNARASRDRTEH